MKDAGRPHNTGVDTRRGTVGFDLDADGSGFDAREWPFFWLTHATSLYLHRLERGLKKVGLDVGRWRVLMCVAPGHALSVTEIAELAIVKLPTMMKLVQRMEAEGLVTCEPRVGDGRVTEVSLTPDGLRARELAWTTARTIFLRVFAEKDGIDFDALNKLLRGVVERLEKD